MRNFQTTIQLHHNDVLFRIEDIITSKEVQCAVYSLIGILRSDERIKAFYYFS